MIGKHLGIPVKHVRTTENPLRLTKNDSVPCHRLHLQGGISAACYLTMVEGLKLAAQTFNKDVKQLSCCAG